MLDVIAGYDPADPVTAFGASKTPQSYTAVLRPDGMEGARIGLLKNVLGNDSVHSEVNAALRDAAALMVGLGGEIVDIEIPRLSDLTSDLSLGGFEFKDAFNDYLADLGPTGPVKTLNDFIRAGAIHPSIRDGLLAAQEVEDGLNAPEYMQRLLRGQQLRQAIVTVMADNDLDALLYPHQRRLVAALGEPQLERNGVLSNGTGFPALTFPGGFSAPTASAPGGVPIGIELLGREWSEPLLFQLAYAFEHAFHTRKPPASTPPLPH
jgi:Asp-tRNA(Asn)/Glu-tRNA(Gln) amidotransferase A subunit family amidase